MTQVRYEVPKSRIVRFDLDEKTITLRFRDERAVHEFMKEHAVYVEKIMSTPLPLPGTEEKT